MGASNATKPATATTVNGLRECVQLGSERILDSANHPKSPEKSPARDALLIALDFIVEAGEHLSVAGMAISAAAATENVDALEMALRHARAVVVDAIGEYRTIWPRAAAPCPELVAEATREYRENIRRRA